MQTHTLESGEEIIVVTSHRRIGVKTQHTIVGTVFNGYVMLGYSFCHKKDMFCKKEGRQIAMERLIHAIETENYQDPLVGCIPLADVAYFNLMESLTQIGVTMPETIYAISEEIVKLAEEEKTLKTRNMVLDAIEICEATIGSEAILLSYRARNV